MNKRKTTMSKETERTLENMQDADLKCLLDEVCSYTGDMQGKSPLVQGLLKQAEESESGEESIKRPPRRHKKPKERRRRKESDSLAARTHAGGSLDNIGGEKKQTAARQRGVAGRTREGGSCCNLSRGSFETTVARRRRRRDPHRQHGGSLEDLSAIDETAAGTGRACSVSESGKHGGSLQNINQEGGGDFRPPAAAPAPAPARTAASFPSPPPTVIDIDAEDRPSAASVGSPRGASEPPDPGRPPPSEQAPADATVDFALRLDPRQQQPAASCREPPRPAPYSLPSGPADLEGISRSVGHLMSTHSAGYSRDDVRDMPPGEPLSSHRRGQASESGGGPGVTNGPRLNSATTAGQARVRKAKKKQEEQRQQLTEDVDGYRGKADIETLLGFIESGDKKDKNGGKKPERARDGRREARGRKNGLREEERPARVGGRGSERRPSGRGGRAAPAGRSSSLEARPGPAAAAGAAAGRADATSVFCGDLAKSSLKKSDSTPASTSRPAAGPSVVAFDGGTYVSPPTAERDSEGFVQDFYSVTTDSTAIEETEFHVVTRKQRRRGGRSGAGDGTRPHALRHKTGSLDESARARHDSLGQPRRPAVPGLRPTASCSAPHSELSDSDSDGAGSLPPAPRRPDPGGGRTPPSSAAPAPSGGSSWADVTRHRQESHAAAPAPAPRPAAGMRDAETSTDFIDGVGPIFGERSSPRGRPVAAVAGFVRGASEPADCLIGGSHPDEFPEIEPPSAPAPAAAPAAAKSPRAGSAAGSAAGGSSASAAAASVTSQATAASADSAPTAAASAPVQTDRQTATQPTVPAPSPAAASVPSPATPAAASVPPPAAAVASRDADSAVSGGSFATPAARATSDTDSPSERRTPPRPAPASAPAPRRTKKAPAVTIRGSPQDAGLPGGAGAHVQGIQFGYIPAWSEPERPDGAVAAFCRRFRPPTVDVSRFNWAEISLYLNKVYDEAARDPSAFFSPSEVPNGLLSPVPLVQSPH